MSLTSFHSKPVIYNNICEAVGYTPLVRLKKISQQLKRQILGKCEFFNPGGSLKDRAALSMILAAEKSGNLKKGDTLIAPTYGTTGIGLAIVAINRGYKLICVVPERASEEKVDVLISLGAEVYRTPNVSSNSPKSYIQVAKELAGRISNSFLIDQFSDEANILAHQQTAEELMTQTGGKFSMIVVPVESGGSITGLAKILKEKIPSLKVVGVEPIGSVLGGNEETHEYVTEGVGNDFVPPILDRKLVDHWYQISDKESFSYGRKLIAEEGLLCGGSSGTALAGAFKAVSLLKEGETCVIILPDTVRNNVTQFINDSWMMQNNFLSDQETEKVKRQDQWWGTRTVSELNLKCPMTISPHMSCHDAVKFLERESFDQVPVISESGEALGVVTNGNLMSKILSGRVKRDDPVSTVVYSQFKQVTLHTQLAELSKIFDHDYFALVVATQSWAPSLSEAVIKTLVVGVVTRIDLVNFIIKGQK